MYTILFLTVLLKWIFCLPFHCTVSAGQNEPYSLELLVHKQVEHLDNLFKLKSSTIVASITVPHDICVCSFVRWMEKSFAGAMGGEEEAAFSYLEVTDKLAAIRRHLVLQEKESDRYLLNLTRRMEAGLPLVETSPVCISPKLPHFCRSDCSDFNEGYALSEDSRRPLSIDRFVVRVSLIQYRTLIDERHHLEPSNLSPVPLTNHTAGGGFTTATVQGSRDAISNLGALDIAVDYGYDDDGENLSCLKDRRLDINFDFALMDILPTPEDYFPAMKDLINKPSNLSPNVTDHTVTVRKHIGYSTYLMVFPVRRLPRRPDEEYPIVKIMKSEPFYYVF